MRQVFLEFPWVHSPAPKVFSTLFQKYGRYECLKPGQAIRNGGTEGEVAWILSGLCTYRLQNTHNRERYLTLVPAGRLVGNVDAFSGDVVNVLDFAIRPSEVLLMARHDFVTCLEANDELSRLHAKVLVGEHESDMEGLFSASTDLLPQRLLKLFLALHFKDEPRFSFSWPKERATLRAIPIPYNLTNTEISKTVGATRTAVSLVMNDWIQKGLVKDHDGCRIIDPTLFDSIEDWLTGDGGPSPTVRKTRRKKS